MQNEHETENGPEEEGEYHFSDESGYESSLDEDAGAAPLAEKSGLGSQLTSYRRFVVVGGLFAGVLLVVYLVAAPPTTPTPTEITEAVNTVAPPTPSPSLKAEVVSAALKAKPAPAPHGAEVAQLPAEPAQVSSPAVTPVAIETTLPAPPIPSSPVMTMTQDASSAANAKMMADRLSALEQSNTKLIAQLQADYSYKLAQSEAENKALAEQVKTLNTKVKDVETAVVQMTQALSKQAPQSAADSGNAEANNSVTLPPVSGTETSAKPGYTVQAIIPGRAWLRSENGETITVAEGDVLKNTGRVTKIDPYDGTIQIDTGSKVIMLTYGNGDYAS